MAGSQNISLLKRAYETIHVIIAENHIILKKMFIHYLCIQIIVFFITKSNTQYPFFKNIFVLCHHINASYLLIEKLFNQNEIMKNSCSSNTIKRVLLHCNTMHLL